MAHSKLRRLIVHEAARLIYSRHESEYYQAKMKAARRICRGWVKPSDLPRNSEIRDEVQRFACLFEGESRTDHLKIMRIEALRIMKILSVWKPRLIGSTLTGHVRQGSDIDLHVFSSSVEAITARLDDEGMVYQIEKKRIVKQGVERSFTHVHVREIFPVEITVYLPEQARQVFRSSITGKPMERASLAEFQQFLEVAYPGMNVDLELQDAEICVDRFQVYRGLLLPLGAVEQNRKFHPEGDVLYHSLQVFELARDAVPYDEEVLLAALLHDVGKGIEPRNHVEAGLEALGGTVSERTRWLIEHHMQAHRYREQTLGHRARKRLAESEYFDDLLLLGDCDRGGREWGVEVCEVDEALDYLRELAWTGG